MSLLGSHSRQPLASMRMQIGALGAGILEMSLSLWLLTTVVLANAGCSRDSAPVLGRLGTAAELHTVLATESRIDVPEATPLDASPQPDLYALYVWYPSLALSRDSYALGRFQINICLDEELIPEFRQEPVQIAILGVDAGDAEAWATGDSRELLARAQASSFAWRTNLPQDLNADNPRNPDLCTLEPTDPIWSAWKESGSTFLVVVAGPPNPGSASEFRRRWVRVLPLRVERWNTSTIRLRVSELGLVLETPPLAPRQVANSPADADATLASKSADQGAVRSMRR